MTKGSNHDSKAKKLAEKNVLNQAQGKVTDELFLRCTGLDPGEV
jgi:hypothetical protein